METQKQSLKELLNKFFDLLLPLIGTSSQFNDLKKYVEEANLNADDLGKYLNDFFTADIYSKIENKVTKDQLERLQAIVDDIHKIFLALKLDSSAKVKTFGKDELMPQKEI